MTIDTYLCNYCFESHDIKTRSREHVIPERLLNQSYVLPDTCAFWNNFFAISFENAVTRSSYASELLDVLGAGKSKGEQYLGPITTRRGTIEHRYRINGEIFLRDHPIKKTKKTINMNIVAQDGSIHSVVVNLPFEVLDRVDGDGKLLSRTMARLDRDYEVERTRVFEYLTQVREDRSIDPELYDHIQSLGPTGKLSNKLTIREETTPASVVDDGELLFALDMESVSKLYIKIAWCHACKVFGPDVLRHLSSWCLVGNLKAGLIPADLARRCVEIDKDLAGKLFLTGTADGTSVWFWRRSIEDTFPLLAKAPKEFYEAIAEAFRMRQAESIHALSRLTIDHPDETVGTPVLGRFHRLELSVVRKLDLGAIFCKIELFGGFWTAELRLTDWHDADSLPPIPQHNKEIHF